MATMVCRGLQSCLDSHLADQRTFIFRPSFEFPQFSHTQIRADEIAGGEPPAAGNGEEGAVYVHPAARRFNPASLSEKSLKLCTENLGNETGSDIIENESSIFSPAAIGGGDLQRRGERRSHSHFHSSSQQFPPPLTTIRETETFRVRPRREEGRLIIAAVKTPARPSCFQAERSHGRLRLCFFETEETEESGGDGDGDEEDEEEVGAETTAFGEVLSEGNGVVNLEQFKIATC